MTSYSLVIPPPWQRIRLGPGMDADVDRAGWAAVAVLVVVVAGCLCVLLGWTP